MWFAFCTHRSAKRAEYAFVDFGPFFQNAPQVKFLKNGFMKIEFLMPDLEVCALWRYFGNQKMSQYCLFSNGWITLSYFFFGTVNGFETPTRSKDACTPDIHHNDQETCRTQSIYITSNKKTQWLSAQFLGAQPLCFFTTFVGIILAMLGRL